MVAFVLVSGHYFLNEWGALRVVGLIVCGSLGLNHQPPRSLFSRIPPTQRSNAKIQHHFQFLPPRTSYKFEEKPAKLLKTNVIKIVLGEKITSWESLRMSISKFSGHVQSIKPLLSESFGGNCERAPRLTTVCILL